MIWATTGGRPYVAVNFCSWWCVNTRDNFSLSPFSILYLFPHTSSLLTLFFSLFSYDNPTTLPSTKSMCMNEGLLDNPGIVLI